MPAWILRDFNLDGLCCQIIEFNLLTRIYVMVFNRIDALRSPEFIDQKATELGLSYKQNSFEVKFDLKQNFENDTFFEPPDKDYHSPHGVLSMRKPGELLKDLLLFHHSKTEAAAYLFVAENKKLKRFYDRLAKRYQEELAFTVMSDLGNEGLGYEITTTTQRSIQTRNSSKSFETGGYEENQSGL